MGSAVHHARPKPQAWNVDKASLSFPGRRLWGGLMHCVPFWTSPDCSVVRDVAGYQQGSIVDGGFSPAAPPSPNAGYGQGYRVLATGARVYENYPNSTSARQRYVLFDQTPRIRAYPFTCFWRGQYWDVDTGDWRGTIDLGGSYDNSHNIGVGVHGTAALPRAHVRNGGGIFYAEGTTTIGGGVNETTGFNLVGLHVSDTDRRILVNATVEGTDSSSAGFPVVDRWGCGQWFDSSPNQGAENHHDVVYLWARVLTPGELQILNEDPYLPIRRGRAVFGFVPAGGGSPQGTTGSPAVVTVSAPGGHVGVSGAPAAVSADATAGHIGVEGSPASAEVVATAGGVGVEGVAAAVTVDATQGQTGYGVEGSPAPVTVSVPGGHVGVEGNPAQVALVLPGGHVGIEGSPAVVDALATIGSSGYGITGSPATVVVAAPGGHVGVEGVPALVDAIATTGAIGVSGEAAIVLVLVPAGAVGFGVEGSPAVVVVSAGTGDAFLATAAVGRLLRQVGVLVTLDARAGVLQVTDPATGIVTTLHRVAGAV